MSADNWLSIEEGDDGLYTVRYGYMSDEDDPGRVVASALSLEGAKLFVPRYIREELQGVLEYGPYWVWEVSE